MDMNPYPHANAYYPCDGDYVRVYSFILIHPVDRLHNHPDVIAHSLRHYRPLPYPYTWCVYGDYAAIVNITDLYEYEIRQRSSSLPSTATNPQLHDPYQIPPSVTVDEVMRLQDVGGHHHVHTPFHEVLESSDEEVLVLDESHDMDQTSGLTKKLISKKLRVTEYQEEEDEDEICVVCQMEFRKNERVVMLRCKHRYHPTCIEVWLLRQNVCPLCKSQALKV